MVARDTVKILIFLAVLAFLAGCENAFLPSAGTYKLNARVNGVMLDECSFISPTDKIYPYFEESVSSDPDVTSLVVYLKNSNGDAIGRKIKYSIDDEEIEEDEETLVPVRNLDYNLPFFPFPENFPVGRYTMVLQVMGGNDVLQRTEKIFYNMGNTVFSYDGISVHFPGITGNPQVIPKETILMLEVQLSYSGRLDPYVVWYNGRRKIGEGRYSDGGGCLFWTAPEESGFFSIRAEVFPTDNYYGLAGYQKDISLLVSSKATDAHLLSGNSAVHWYVFEGNLNDSKMKTSAERALKSTGNKNTKWIPVNGTYGLAAGPDNVYTLPKIFFSEYETEIWQAVFRFMSLNEGQIFAVLFEEYPDVSMKLSVEGQNLVLRLASSERTVSQSVRIPEKKSFITAGINFSILPDSISAKINIIEDSVEQGVAAGSITLETGVKDTFQILLGEKKENSASRNNTQYTAIWDEFALYNAPSMDAIAEEIKQSAGYMHPKLDTYISY